jgi:hypothetical protein
MTCDLQYATLTSTIYLKIIIKVMKLSAMSRCSGRFVHVYRDLPQYMLNCLNISLLLMHGSVDVTTLLQFWA